MLSRVYKLVFDEASSTMSLDEMPTYLKILRILSCAHNP